MKPLAPLERILAHLVRHGPSIPYTTTTRHGTLITLRPYNGTGLPSQCHRTTVGLLKSMKARGLVELQGDAVAITDFGALTLVLGASKPTRPSKYAPEQVRLPYADV